MGGRKWTKHEDTTLLKNVAFDHRGFACNEVCFVFNKKQPTPVPASVSQTVNN